MSGKNVIIIILENTYVKVTNKWHINSVIKEKRTIWVHRLPAIYRDMFCYNWVTREISYTKFTYPENTSLWYISCQQLKPAFYSSHLSCNMPYSGAATIQVFYFPWQRYSYLTQSSMMELLLSVSQHWNFHLG